KPDLVLAWDAGNPEPALTALEDLGVRVWRTEVEGPDAIAALLDDIGRATGRESVATARSARLRARIEDLRAAHRERVPVRYFYQVAERPLYTINGAHPISRGLAICGGENVFAELGTLAPQISPEAVLREDPQVLVAGRLDDGGEPLAHWRAWPRLRAVRDDALFYLHADWINRATPRMVDALEEACHLFDDYRERAGETGGDTAQG
ncbi:MAG: ABC transporter substrate-binding protein, partial [Gammaproteobacteria bacterium]